ncbi:hypothetical protein MIR68_001328 [Amoeboaphelidium protococcarum]|nr:hypothetical protein MIR68_001328 [Amoeboaphelidium protococcarum]
MYKHNQRVTSLVKQSRSLKKFPLRVYGIRVSSRLRTDLILIWEQFRAWIYRYGNFLASSLSLFPPQWCHQIAYQYQKRVKRSHNQWYAVIAPDAVDNQLDMLVRMTVTIGIAMHAVRHESKPDFRTALDVKIFTKLWAPVMNYWKPIHQWQSGNLHGLVIYENEQERTLAVIFRPYTDPKVLGNHINSFLTDPEAYSEAFPMSYVSALDGEDKVFDIYGKPIMVVNPLIDEYIPMEMEVLTFLQAYRASQNPKADKIVTGGISAAGVYAQLFAIRLHSSIWIL